VLKGGEDNVVLDEEKKELTIFFEYRGLTDAEHKEHGTRNVREKIIESVKEEILNSITDDGLKGSLGRTKDQKTLLEKHLNTYTKKNTTDYFIHKDLKGFLERELDFYIKNEVLNLDDLGSEKETSIEKYITRVKVIKAISQKIIEFLAQIEDFQKKLWEKKKFVIKTDYCMTLDKVPEEFYEEIVKNEEQINEWKDLFKLEEVEKGTLEYAVKGQLTIDVDYLKSNPYLVLDTKFFDQDFKDRLLATFEDLDEEIGGVMIKSENWQALNLLQDRFRKKMKCCYLDPPFNTGGSEFIYKNEYRHSSWCAMMWNSLEKTRNFLTEDGILFTAIDDFELHYLGLVLNDVFGEENKLGVLVVEIKPSGRTNDKFLATCHEYYLCFSSSPDKANIRFFELSEDQKEQYKYEDEIGPYKYRDFLRTGGYSTPEERPNSYYPIYYNEETKTISLTKEDNTIEILPIDSNGKKRVWRKTKPSFIKHVEDGDILIKKTNQGIYKVYIKDRIKKGIRPKSVWIGSKYDASSHGTKLLDAMFAPARVFDYPKSLYAVQDVIRMVSGPRDKDYIMDFFAGSNTTAHSIISLNKTDGGQRRYVVIEMGNHFDTATKPRIQKVMYTKDWKDGKPTSKDGSSHMFKYQYLEQYEDALNNIEFVEAGAVQKTLEDMDDYFLKYMLDFETRDSPTRLNVDKLERPFEYKLKITNNENEMREEVVDLVETFNYLLGLHVMKIRAFENNGTYYRLVIGKKGNDTIAVIWRNTDGLDLKADKEFIEGTVLKDFEAKTVYVNGDSYLENARPIEPEFKRLMGG
jgi:adenine-specific DNA-methyltransferase